MKLALTSLLGAAGALILVASRTAHGGAERPLSRAEAQATRAGATIDIGNPSTRTVTSQNASQPLMVVGVGYAGTDRLHLETWVNGTKTGYMLATYSAWGADAPNILRVPMPLVPPSPAEVELRIYNETQVQRWTTYGAQGGVLPDAKRTYEWSPSMKVAGINFWLVSAGGMTAALPANVREMIDRMDPPSTPALIDDILKGKTLAKGSTLAESLNCTLAGWNLTHRATRNLSLGNVDCLNPTIREPRHPSWGPDPSCSDFASRVNTALAAADANYRDYVNVVVVDDLNVWNATEGVYEANVIAGFHPGGTHWSALVPQIWQLDATTIAHELGHEMGLDHRADNDPDCDAPILGNAPIMCRFTGRGADAAYCNTAERFTGIRNLNPVH